MSKKSLIIIPARYGSSRFPGKPLALIAGKTMLERVCEAAKLASERVADTDFLVATDHPKIYEHAQSLNVKVVMTPSDCPCGTDRALAAIEALNEKPENIVNLQGDAPLTPAFLLDNLLEKLANPKASAVTPIVQLPWPELDKLRAAKKEHPFSGTTVIINDKEEAIWFSKNIIPAIREEETLRKTQPLSPVYQHIGLYGYKRTTLETFAKLPQSPYERLEGLEQLRLLENGFTLQTFSVPASTLPLWRGVDTPADAAFIEEHLTS